MGQLFIVPAGHGWQSSLVLLDLSNNQIGPSLQISAMASLDTLNVASNRLSSLALGETYPMLAAFLASGNHLLECPRSLLPQHAPKLATLDLSNNSLTTVPPELGLSQALKRVSLEGNVLRSIRPDLLRGGAEKLKAYLRTRLTGTHADDTPASPLPEEPEHIAARLSMELRDSVASRELRLEGRGLAALPPLPPGLRTLQLPGNALNSEVLCRALCGGGVSAGPFQTLQVLGVSRNTLGTDSCIQRLLPRLLVNLPALQDLDLSFNQLEILGPAAPWGCTQASVVRVDLSGNSLPAFPAELLQACPKLDELRVRQNHLICLGALAAVPGIVLSILDLEENRLTALPSWLPTALPRLRTLLLANNCVGPTLPPELGFWDSLQAVSLAGNPLRGVRQSLISAGWPAVAECLRDRLPVGASTVVAVPLLADAMPPLATSKGYDADRCVDDATVVAPESRVADAPCNAAPAIDSTAPVQAHIAKLMAEVGALEEELTAPGMSRARQSTATHSLRMKRAELLKAERELRRVAAVADGFERRV